MAKKKDAQKLFDSFLKKSTFDAVAAAYAKYGIPGYISTGLPNLDLHLMHNPQRTQYGLPRGRICEFVGNSSSFKSTFGHLIISKVLQQGGQAFVCTSEMDWDMNYLSTFLKSAGMDPDPKKYPIALKPVNTVKELYDACKEIVDFFEVVADEIQGKDEDPLNHLPPTVIVCDSLAAMMGDENFDRIEEDWDQGERQGSHANELHRFFKRFVKPFARLGVLFLFTNHMRANMSMWGSNEKPAHDKIIQYYSTLRVEVKTHNRDPELKKSYARNKVTLAVGQAMTARIRKIRGDVVGDSEVELRYFYNHGFDYLWGLIDAMHRSEMIKQVKRDYEIEFDEDDELSVLNGRHSLEELKTLFKDNLELAALAEVRAFKRGHKVLEDLR